MRVYDAEETCNNIFMLAEKRGWNDSRLASIMELSLQAISKWRKGGSPSTDTLVVLADLFEVSLDEIMGRREIDMEFHMEDQH